MSARRAAGLLTRGTLPHRLPGPKPSDVVVGKHLPLQRRDRPGLAPEFPYRSPVWSATLAWRSVVTSVALDLDAVLADTRPLWRDWLEDAARRARVDLDVPDDREAAAAALDESLGDWRPLLERFAADRGPIHFRPRAETSASLRRLDGAGVRIGVFTDAPRELADVALAHVGAARRVAVVGTLDEVLRELGADAVIVRSRDELALLDAA